MKKLKEISKIFLTKELLIFLLLINTALHYANFRFEKVDLPNATKKLVIDTIKNELARDPKTKEIKNLENVLDEISYANQLGRLDTISLILALLGLVLGFGAIFGFLHIKERSEDIAKNETERWLKSPDGERLIKGLTREIVKEALSNVSARAKTSRTKRKLEEEDSNIDFGSTYYQS